VPGIIELSCESGLKLSWEITPPPGYYPRTDSNVTLLLHRSDDTVALKGGRSSFTDGWTNGAEIGDAQTPITRLIAHWFNLPNLHAPIEIVVEDESGSCRVGHWSFQVCDWLITIDIRPDFKEVWRDLRKRHVYVMTHVMEVRRGDGGTFTPEQATPVLEALHLSISFALGRWAAPMLPVGFDEAGRAVWEQWRPLHCDPGRNIDSGWWQENEHDSLIELLTQALKVFSDHDLRPALRLQFMFAIVAAADRGFVEQRIMAGGTGLEHIMWQLLVLDGPLEPDDYRPPAHPHLRRVLTDAGIPTDIDSEISPTIARFITEETVRQGRILDGPDAVTQVRNRLVHPKGSQERIYSQDDLLTEVWTLTRHYLTLLILHSLGYNGSYRDLRQLQGFALDFGFVPWRQHTS
jgi:hypothetical protein